jgi:hypothetical protein
MELISDATTMIASKSVEVKSSVTTIGGKSSVSFPWQFAFD